MPNHPVVVSGAIVIVSVAVAAAIAVYESPQARQFAEDVRRRIALALHSLGDEINPSQPRFNRPEDAEGFLQSQGSADVGVEADEDSKRRQREELMYWNAVHMEKMEKDRKMAAARPAARPANMSRGSSFDDFLHQDKNAEKGTLVYNTGAAMHPEAEEGLRNRGLRGLNRSSVYADPFSDEHNIDPDTQRAIDASLISPEASEKLESMSDIYSASDSPQTQSRTRQTTATIAEQLIDTSEPADIPDPPISYPSIEDPMSFETTNFTNMVARDDSAYASIHAWADNANNSFYSPLPITPGVATPQQQQEPETSTLVWDDPAISVPGSGAATPTDSESLAGSGEEVWAPRSGATSEADVISVDGDEISTPGTWTEVGSVVSESDVGAAVGVYH